MAVDLVSQIQRVFSSEVIQKLSLMLDEQPDRVGQVLSLGAPTILAGMFHAVSGPADSKRLVDVVKDVPEAVSRLGGFSGLAGQLGDLAGKGALEPVIHHGQSLLRSIFGDKLDGVLAMITTDSGAEASSTASLMGLLAPIVTGLIRQTNGESGITTDALHTLLMEQRDSIARLAPGGLAKLLGGRDPADFGLRPVAAPAPVRRPAPEAAQGPGHSRWAIPLGLGLLVLAVGYYWLADHGEPGEPVESPRTTAPSAPKRPIFAEGEGGHADLEAIAKQIPMALPGDVTIDVPEGSFLQAAITEIREATDNEPRTYTASDLRVDAEFKLAPQAASTIDHLVKIATAYPKVKYKIVGREAPADADPAQRHAAAAKRAEVVRQALVRAGVPTDRVAAEAAKEPPPANLAKNLLGDADVDLVITRDD